MDLKPGFSTDRLFGSEQFTYPPQKKTLNFMCHLVESLYTSYVVPLTTLEVDLMIPLDGKETEIERKLQKTQSL